jgi:hypothetical protein
MGEGRNRNDEGRKEVMKEGRKGDRKEGEKLRIAGRKEGWKAGK